MIQNSIFKIFDLHKTTSYYYEDTIITKKVVYNNSLERLSAEGICAFSAESQARCN